MVPVGKQLGFEIMAAVGLVCCMLRSNPLESMNP